MIASLLIDGHSGLVETAGIAEGKLVHGRGCGFSSKVIADSP